MHRVPGRDAIFLYMESPAHHMHVAFAAVLDPSAVLGRVPGPVEIYERLRSLLEQRLHLFPPFRQRLVEVPFGLHHPVFVEDPEFDLSFHLRRAALPTPGGDRALEEFVGDLVSRPMDRSRPLWEIFVVEGLEQGRWALVAKAHHAIVDGTGGNEILVNLLDLSPDVREVEPPAETWKPEHIPSDAKLLGSALAATATSPPQLLRALGQTAGTVARVARRALAGNDEPPLVTLGPRTMLNQPVSARRQVAFGEISLDEVKRVKNAFSATVNDVVLAMCGRGLRRYLAAHGEELSSQLVAAVPISIRVEDHDAVGNRVAGMTIPLADDADDPGEQMVRIRTVTGPAKERLGAITADLLTDWTEFATPALAVQAFRFYASSGLSHRVRPVANVTISNVPGPNIPLFVAGSRLERMYPVGPIVPGQALNVTVVSYLGRMFVSVVGCPDVLPGLDGVVSDIGKGLTELLGAAESAQS